MPATDCDPGCTCRGLREELEDPVSEKERRLRIAVATAEQVPCPYCRVGTTDECVTFPGSKRARRPHASRVDLRLARIPVPGP